MNIICHDSASRAAAQRPEPRRFRFLDLPPELQNVIWELDCPDLQVRAQTHQFQLFIHSVQGGEASSEEYFMQLFCHWSVFPRVRALGRFMAIHKKTHTRVCSMFPQTLLVCRGYGGWLPCTLRVNLYFDSILLSHASHLYNMPASLVQDPSWRNAFDRPFPIYHGNRHHPAYWYPSFEFVILCRSLTTLVLQQPVNRLLREKLPEFFAKLFPDIKLEYGE